MEKIAYIRACMSDPQRFFAKFTFEPKQMNFEELSKKLKVHFEVKYSSELQVIQLKSSDLSVTIFRNGQVTIRGAKSRKQVEEFAGLLTKVIGELT